MFAAALVAWLVSFLGDGMVKGLRRGAMGKPEHRALVKAMSIAVTATLEGVPLESREALAAALQDRFTEPPSLVADGHTRVRTSLMRGIQAQLAPLSDPSITPAGKSFFDEIGVDTAQIRDGLTDAVIRSIEQVGPSFPSLSPLVIQLNADAIIERVDDVVEMIGATQRKPDTADGKPIPVQQGTGNGRIPGGDIEALTDAFLAVPALADDELRQTVFDLLPDRLRNGIPRSRYPRIQVLQMIRAAGYYNGGMRAMLRAVRIIEGDSPAMRQLDVVILGLEGKDGVAGGLPDAGGFGA